jgi:hypothetical protein
VSSSRGTLSLSPPHSDLAVDAMAGASGGEDGGSQELVGSGCGTPAPSMVQPGLGCLVPSAHTQVLQPPPGRASLLGQ